MFWRTTRAAKETITVRIIFNSGYVQDLTCTKFTVFTNNVTGELTKIAWENTVPDIIDIRLDDISAIFRLR